MNNNLAPIVIFTYRRKPEKLFKSLLKNEFARDSEVFIFSDGYKNDEDFQDILEVRKFLKNLSGFKSVKIIESEKNKGLAKSIIEGVTRIITEYGKVIVLEDDLVVSEDFLNFMNGALEFYQDNGKIWSISGYCPNMPCLKDYKKDVFLSVRSSSWGWATWKDRWEKTDWEVTDWNTFKKDKKRIQTFNQGGNDLFKMLELQMLGKIDSWAIRWCYSQFKHNMFAVYPVRSKISNEGFEDNKGTHNNSTTSDKWHVKTHNNVINFEHVEIDNKILKCFKEFHDLNTATKLGYFTRKYGGYKLAKSIYKLIKR